MSDTFASERSWRYWNRPNITRGLDHRFDDDRLAVVLARSTRTNRKDEQS